MKVICKGYEREVVCTGCKALLYYTPQDVHYVGDLESEYRNCVKCPECDTEIEIKL